ELPELGLGCRYFGIALGLGRHLLLNGIGLLLRRHVALQGFGSVVLIQRFGNLCLCRGVGDLGWRRLYFLPLLRISEDRILPVYFDALLIAEEAIILHPKILCFRSAIER